MQAISVTKNKSKASRVIFFFESGNGQNAFGYDFYTVRLDRSRQVWLVRTWEEDSCLYEIPLTWVARALKSFLEQVGGYLQMYQTPLPLVFLIHNLSYVSQFEHMKRFMVTCNARNTKVYRIKSNTN